MSLRIFTYLVFTILLLTIACDNSPNKKQKINTQDYKEPLIKANKELVKSEDEMIEDYIARYQWKMNKTGTGLRYWIYKEGNGPKAMKDYRATINYTVELLNGDICYSSSTEAPKEFMIGKGGVESGLEEGILLLKKGDRAKFIIPSHLAFGLLGDSDKIPAKASLVYDVELIELKN